MTRYKLSLATVFILLSGGIVGCDNKTTVTEVAPTTKASKAGYSDSQGVLTDYTAPTPADSSGKKLFAIYMVGSDLEDQNSSQNTGEGSGSVDFGELVRGYNTLSAEEKDSVDIIVAFGGSLNWPGMRIANIEQIIEDYSTDKIIGNLDSQHYLYDAPKAHMGDKSSLELFLKYVGDSYSGHDFTFLDMWDHGSAFGSFGNDSNYNHDGLTMQETDDALTAAGLKFDTIGYDACLNANFELSSIIKKHADYLIASAETEPGHGWDYEDVIVSYVRNGNFKLFALEMIDNFVDNKDHTDDGKTLSVVDLSHYDNLLAAVNEMAVQVNNNIDDTDVKDLVVQMHNPFNSDTSVEGYGKSTEGKGRRGRRGRRSSDAALTYDLWSFAETIRANTTNELQNSASKVLDVLGDYIIYARSDSTRPNAKGVTIASMTGESNLNEDQTPSESYRTLGTYIDATYSQNDTTPPAILSSRSLGKSQVPTNLKLKSYQQKDSGTSIKIIDDNLKRVTTLYGNVLPDEDGNDAFLSVAELGTFKTEIPNEYFTPTWNQKWYLLKFGEGEFDDTPLFLTLSQTFKNSKGNIEYTIYSAEIDFINQHKDYSEQEQEYDFAKLNVKIDSNDNVVSTTVLPFKTLYSSEEDEEGHVVFEKYGKPLTKGDQIRMYSFSLDLTTGENFLNAEGDGDDFIKITQDPTYTFEELLFEGDDGEPLDYYYMMIAEDLAGNITKTEPVPASK